MTISESLSGDGSVPLPPWKSCLHQCLQVSIFLWHCCPDELETRSRDQFLLYLKSKRWGSDENQTNIWWFFDDFPIRPQPKLGIKFGLLHESGTNFGVSSVYDILSPIWWLSTSRANSFCCFIIKACTHYSHSAFVFNVIPFSFSWASL